MKSTTTHIHKYTFMQLCQIRQEDKDELLDKLFQVVGHQFETNEVTAHR